MPQRLLANRHFSALLVLTLLTLPLRDVCAGVDILLFPDVIYSHLYRTGPTRPALDEFQPGLDTFVSADNGRWRALGEFLLTRREHEMERLQFGWVARPELTLWLGRFHNSLEYWHTAYHHGAFMQTSISRPGMIAFEDHGGLLPAHLTGLLLEGQLNGANESAWLYNVALGKGPEAEVDAAGDAQLEPLDVLRPGHDRHGNSATLHIGYRPQILAADEFGLFMSHTDIPGSATLRSVTQGVIGAYGSFTHDPWRIISAYAHFDHRIDDVATTSHSAFDNAYVQLEYSWRTEWTPYARLEGSHGAATDQFVALLPDFVRQRVLAGVRYDFSAHQAIKLETSAVRIRDSHYAELQVQWTAVWP